MHGFGRTRLEGLSVSTDPSKIVPTLCVGTITARVRQPRALAVFFGRWKSVKTLLYSAKVPERGLS
jgi:hypothetical protein